MTSTIPDQGEQSPPEPAGATGDVLPWMSAEQAAQLMNVSVCTLRKLAKRGQIPHKLVGTRYRFRQEDLLAWPGCPPRAAAARSRFTERSWREEIAAMNPYKQTG